ncbi:MAG: DUF1501 domain-containing protein [Pirellulales bacterium]
MVSYLSSVDQSIINLLPSDESLSPRELARMSRRRALFRMANGFGGLSLCALASCSSESQPQLIGGAASGGKRAKNVIYLYMSGGPSQIDTFDPKPRLAKEHGQEMKLKIPPIQFNGANLVMQSPFKFKRYGESGIDVSEIFPNVAKCVDDMCVVRSMVADHGEHGTANLFMNTGSALRGRPSMGAWINYGLGSESEDLPGYVVLESGRIPLGGLACFGSGFLPARHQGTVFRRGSYPVEDIQPREPVSEIQQAKLSLIEGLNRDSLEQFGSNDMLDAVVENYELAFRMQSSVPDLVDFRDESSTTIEAYGVNDSATEDFGSQCLIARRLVERGVRFVQLLPPRIKGLDLWDQHRQLRMGHEKNAHATDKPIAALLQDLKARGMLDETLVIWGGEFGRTPMQHTMPANFSDRDGRGHNRYGFTMWLAGGGVKPGCVYGATDEYGMFAVENPVHVHDMHATILHLLGINHEELTFKHGGREFRLTDVYGKVVHDIVA